MKENNELTKVAEHIIEVFKTFIEPQIKLSGIAEDALYAIFKNACFVTKKYGIKERKIIAVRATRSMDFVIIEIQCDDYKWHTIDNKKIFIDRHLAEMRLDEILKEN